VVPANSDLNDADVKNAASVVGQYQEDVQDAEADGRDREEVD